MGDQVNGDLARQGEVAGGDGITNPAVILLEGHVQYPVQIIFNRPVTTDGLCQN